MPTEIGIHELVERYDTLLLDAYGVLVHATGAMPGAAELLAHLEAVGKPFFVVTNDASKLPETASARYRSFGLAIDPEHMITSGQLLARVGLAGARCMVLGTEDTAQYVRAAGGEVVEADEDGRYDAIIVGDDAGFPFLPTMDDALTALYRHFDRGDTVRMILPNPDLLYPKSENSFGFTAGGAAMLLEAGLARRYPKRGLRFERLGKPFEPMFAEARRRAGTGNLIMIGDQLETDIAGAVNAGIDSALLTTGVTRWDENADTKVRPTYLLATMATAK